MALCPGDDFLALFVHAHPERDVLVHVQMRKERVFLENGVDLPLVRRKAGDFFAVEKDVALVGADKAADDAQRRRLAAAGRAEQRHELAVPDIEIQVLQNRLPVKRYGNPLQRKDRFFSQCVLPPCGEALRRPSFYLNNRFQYSCFSNFCQYYFCYFGKNAKESRQRAENAGRNPVFSRFLSFPPFFTSFRLHKNDE